MPVKATQTGKVYEIAGETVIGPRKPGYNFGVNIESIRPALAEAERFVRWFTEQVVLEDIQHPVTVQIGGQKSMKKDALAHFSKSRLISADEAEKLGVGAGIYGGWQTKEGQPVHEILLNAEALEADEFEIMHRLAHEVVHLYQNEIGEKGTAKSGRHNKLFAERAESFGLTVTESDKASVGYGQTGLSDELRQRIADEFQPVSAAWNLFRSASPPKATARKSTVAFKCECEDGAVIRLASGKAEKFSAHCNICDTDYVQSESE